MKNYEVWVVVPSMHRIVVRAKNEKDVDDKVQDFVDNVGWSNDTLEEEMQTYEVHCIEETDDEPSASE